MLVLLDYAGVAVFAATGALAASRKQIDIIGFLFLGAVTGIGGGTLRDLILDVPVFWVVNPAYIFVCAVIAVCIFFTAHLVESRYRLLLWLDAVGLAVFCVMGAAKGLAVTGSMSVAIITGMLTATFGGILRDMLAQEPSVLMRPEVYVTAALAGATSYTVLASSGMAGPLAAIVGVSVAFCVRGGAIRFGWTVSPYRARPGRPPEDLT